MKLEEKDIVIEKLGETIIKIAFDTKRYNMNNLMRSKFHMDMSQKRGIMINYGDPKVGIITIDVNPTLVERNELAVIVNSLIKELQS